MKSKQLLNEYKKGMNPSPRRVSFEAKHILSSLKSNFVSQLVRTRVVNRLIDVSFLGAIDYSPWGSRVSRYLTSRFDHSLGVALLASEAAEALNLDSSQRNVALAAALLHDIGHGPLSHSLEAAFERHLGLNHHIATTDLLIGPSASARELRSALSDYEVDVDEVLALITGKHATHPLTELFGGPINLDTIEGILRSANYRDTIRNTPTPLAVLNAAITVIKGDIDAIAIGHLDDFWQLKGLIYSQLVRGPIGLLSDFKAQQFFDDNSARFEPRHFQFTDDALGQEFPELFSWLLSDELSSVTTRPLSKQIAFVRRTFVVNGKADAASGPRKFLQARYKQGKLQGAATLRLATVTTEEESGTWEISGRSKSDAHTAMV